MNNLYNILKSFKKLKEKESLLKNKNTDRIYSHAEVVESAKKYGNPDIMSGTFFSDRYEPDQNFKIQSIPLTSLHRFGETPNKPLFHEGGEEDEAWAHKYSKKYHSNKTHGPIIAHPMPDGTYDIVDGRHRSRASFLRGETHIDAFVPVNNELKKGLKGDWEKEGYKISHRDSIDNEDQHHFSDDNYRNLHVYAHDKHGNLVGYTKLSYPVKQSASPLQALRTDVDPQHQRKGLASAMYAHAEKILGMKIIPGYDQSEAAQALWSQSNRSFGKSDQDLQDMIKLSKSFKKMKELEKSVGRVVFPKIDNKMTRPDQQIADFKNPEMHARSVSQKYMNQYDTKPDKNFQKQYFDYTLNTVNQVPNPLYGINTGISYPDGTYKNTGGFVDPAAKPRAAEHEGFHHMIGHVSEKLKLPTSVILNDLNRFIPLKEQQLLQQKLSDLNYDPSSHSDEMIPLLRDVLVHDKHREFVLNGMSETEQRSVMMRLKQAFKQIRDRANKVTADDYLKQAVQNRQSNKNKIQKSQIKPVHTGPVVDDDYWIESYNNSKNEVDNRLYYLYKSKKYTDEGMHVSVIGVIHDGKILLGKRSDNHKWTNPGGHLNPGEDPLTGAYRELLEETGIKADKLHYLGTELVTTPKGKKKIIHAFSCYGNYKTNSKNDPDLEVKKWDWIPFENGLPKEVTENLHSPKNVLFEKLGIDNKEEPLEKGLKGDWEKEGDYKISHKEDNASYPGEKRLIVNMHHASQLDKYGSPIFGKGVAGSGVFLKKKDGTLKPLFTTVEPEHRRKGIASAIYHHAEKISGHKITPSDMQSEDAEKLWANPNRTFGLSKSIPRIQPNGDVIQSVPGFEDHHPELIDGINMNHTIRDLNPDGANLGNGTRSVSHKKLPMNLVVKPAQNEENNPEVSEAFIDYGHAHFLHNDMTTAHREGLYHKLASKFFGLGDYVPPTTVFYYNHQPHSAQVYLPGSKNLLQYKDSVKDKFPEAVANDDYEPIYDSLAPQSERHKLAIMNTVLGNNDRHHGNVLIQNGKLKLIDHGLAFDYSENPYADRPIAYIDNHNASIHPEAANWLLKLDENELYNHMINSKAPKGFAQTAKEKLKDIKGLLQHKQSRQQTPSLNEVVEAAAGHGIDNELGYKEYYSNIHKPWRS